MQIRNKGVLRHAALALALGAALGPALASAARRSALFLRICMTTLPLC